MSVAGIIFSNLHDKNISELTHLRTIASVPFGCRYRLVDFALSNMVNSGIQNISIITHYNYHSLMDHVGSGKDWDLARRSGGIRVLPPFITAYASGTNTLYNSRLEALKNAKHSISLMQEEYIVLSDCDAICNIDLKKMIDRHIDSKADITIAVKRMKLTREIAAKCTVVRSDESGVITDVAVNPSDYRGEHDVNINIWVIGKKYLSAVIHDSEAHNYKSFMVDIISKNIGRNKFMTYRFDDYYANVTSLADYFYLNMEILKKETREKVFNIAGRPILTKVRNSAPTRYGKNAVVKNSMIADGCTIEGIIENSVLFRGVTVGRDSIIKNSILFQDTFIGQNVFLNCVISDKNTILRDAVMLSGHNLKPYYVEKGKML
ncbi:MAG: glucose-1-phosphate adenylyltransferase subunit GlgD [Ruminococcaceae bacterium]|nr:glucose-1-phosphate adenylyltransferase subunit GlgD [Oscillospiraceae bacterium]